MASLARRLQKEGLPLGTLLRSAVASQEARSALPEADEQKTAEVKFRVLMEAPPDARECMQVWAKLEHSPRVPMDCALAVETGMLLLPALVQPSDDLDQELASVRQTNETTLAKLDELAQEVVAMRQQHSTSLFPESLQATSAAGTATAQVAQAAEQQLTAARQQASVLRSRAQLETIAQVLTRQHKFRYKPFEWLYEGLDPLLLQPVLEKRQGIPLTLAVLYCSVGLRLGIPLLPQRVPPPATGAAYAASLQSTRHASKINANEQPSIEPWLLETRPPVGEQSPKPAKALALHVDPCSGEVLSTEACTAAHPTYLEGWRPSKSAHVHVWCELLRTAKVAHQRRGDSDSVAHCTYQLLALDHDAPEWVTVLGKELGQRQRL